MMKPSILALLAALIVILRCTRGCVEKERLALLDFKKSFASFPHKYDSLSSWNFAEGARNCCSWEGITCDDLAGNVITLNLGLHRLESSQLRPSLVELQYLSSLDLSGNAFSMRIPTFIGSLHKLMVLDLSNSGFFGRIPPHLGNLTSLHTLYLDSNKLSSDNFQWLSRLSSLEFLYMESSNFNEARDWLSEIRKLPLLSYFVCSSCSLPSPDLSFPSNVNSSTPLQHLDLSQNNLDVGIFKSFGNLYILKELYASNCSIKQSLVNLLQDLTSASSSLEILDLGSNNLTGTIPPILKFQSVNTLFLSDNHLDSFHSHKQLFPSNLSYLDLSSNSINGIFLDAYFANFDNLHSLNLQDNPNLTVSLSKSLGQLSYMLLSSCKLGPIFPTWLLAQNRFVHLDISNSMISGTIPVMFWRNLSPSLVHLNLSRNNLHGVVPNLPFPFDSFGALGSLLVIDLSSNAFNGPIPYLFFQAKELHLSNNNFSGFAPNLHFLDASTPPPSIPVVYPRGFPNPGIQHVDFPSPTDVVDISDNSLSGTLPDWFWALIYKFGALNLENNNLYGSIPSLVEDRLHLYVLILRNNRFSGPLPLLLKNCTQLRILDLSINRFSGQVPDWIGQDLKELAVLSLKSNNLTNNLPKTLCHLTSLQILDLSHNNFSGEIPSCVHNFSAMALDVNTSTDIFVFTEGSAYKIPIEQAEFYHAFINWKGKDRWFQKNLHLVKLISLSSNNLRGEIPTGLTSLVGLESLDLSSNNLIGGIPNNIGQLKSLELLNLSYNKLDGEIPTSLSDISSLGTLDLAHNNLSGRIPGGTQLEGFDSSAFDGNPKLCGSPLNVKCAGDGDDPTRALQPFEGHDIDKEEKEFFYGGLGIGFAFGFLGILGTLTWIGKWRYAFFHFATKLGEWVLLEVALNKSIISRKLRSE